MATSAVAKTKRKPRVEKSIDEQIKAAQEVVKSLQRKKAATKFDQVIKKHQQAITAIYDDLKKASGKQRGIDAEILTVIADAMGMKGMTITKKNPARKT